MENLFTTFTSGDLQLKNRVVLPPMCNFNIESKDGIPTDWHYVHYVSRAMGGCGLIIIEMTNVEADGRITDKCMGLWDDNQIEPLKRIVEGCQKYGAKVGIQIGHAGRKAEDASKPVAPSSIAFSEKYRVPHELSTDEVKDMVKKYQDAVRRALTAGVDTIEIHGAHGYLIHQFHSPLSNKRTDIYGEQFTRFGEEVIRAAKAVMPENMPLIVRISAVEYAEDGYKETTGIQIAKAYQDAGADIIHVSTGGDSTSGATNSGPGYQIPYATAIKEALSIPVITVGRLESAQLANQTVQTGQADLVAVGRGMLKNPNWTFDAAKTLGEKVDSASMAMQAGFSI